MNFEQIAAQGMALLLGGVSGGIVSGVVGWLTWRRAARGETASHLLSEALAIQSEHEAWILEGGTRDTKLSDVTGVQMTMLDGEPDPQRLWLRRVEVRVMLDDALWNSPENQFYGFLEGRRAWIVRDRIVDEPSQGTSVGSRPGLLSSRAMEGLVAWIERVESAKSSRMLSRNGFQMLWPLLLPLAADDKITVFSGRLPDHTKVFLREILEKHHKEFGQWQDGRGVWSRSQRTDGSP